ncbi:MAG: hypothetical protein QOC84_779 [Bradyrhizobium sp.]|jgi:hypothetical protein|nr:hypothetical protein [Bradyrhizobium sp.]
MTRAQPVELLSLSWRTGRAALAAIALLCVLAAPSRSPAQDAGVSGIPPGPANARGLNGSVSDPSGIGNARVPSLPPPVITPAVPPSVSPPLSSYRPAPAQRVVRFRRPRFATTRSRRTASRAAVRAQGRLLDRGVPSICRGC